MAQREREPKNDLQLLISDLYFSLCMGEHITTGKKVEASITEASITVKAIK